MSIPSDSRLWSESEIVVVPRNTIIFRPLSRWDNQISHLVRGTCSLVFRMVEAEEEYMEQLEVLVSCFLRPFKMAASSKKPPCTHEDVNSIFLNSETVLFLHQIFLKGLTARMESWPTLVLGNVLFFLDNLSFMRYFVCSDYFVVYMYVQATRTGPYARVLNSQRNWKVVFVFVGYVCLPMTD